ncbi:MAG: hypothetical protein AVDCRST_MAG83-1721 [uncultured Arthrobacter sp.]|uniref:DUF3168 domain-containing protein n=1 Tax=uncultured Arthrobacter sp. TaxID=114050 RepID=A0A6J4I643_9MICC|nr:hypothetical protein [uncultured Arthrobacter sp.]CAA9242617.1 MAG: hypothetical protein AVDCRST_MAG83-1721 [uncultured Arthrobacter sp.]
MSDLDALISRLTTAGVVRVYKFGSVPASPSYPYAVVSPAYGAPTVRTLDGSGKPIGRFTVQFFGRLIDGLVDAAAKAFVAFDGVELSELDGDPVAWQELSTPPYRDPDTAGVLDITHTYRF